MKNDTNKKLLKRLKIIEGQVRGLQRMIEDKEYCVDIITQTSAVKKALSGVEDEILKEHLESCAIEQVKGDKESQMIDEILKVYRLSKNK